MKHVSENLSIFGISFLSLQDLCTYNIKNRQRRNNFWETRNFQQRIRGKKRKIFQFCKDQSMVKNKPGSKSVYNTTQTRNLESFEVYILQQSFKLVKLYNQKFYLKVLLLIIPKYLTHGIFFLYDADQICFPMTTLILFEVSKSFK